MHDDARAICDATGSLECDFPPLHALTTRVFLSTIGIFFNEAPATRNYVSFYPRRGVGTRRRGRSISRRGLMNQINERSLTVLPVFGNCCPVNYDAPSVPNRRYFPVTKFGRIERGLDFAFSTKNSRIICRFIGNYSSTCNRNKLSWSIAFYSVIFNSHDYLYKLRDK